MSIATRPALRNPKSLWSYNPIPNGCVLYLPLWHPNLSQAVFKSIDPYGHTCTRTNGVMDSSGFTADGDDHISCGANTALHVGIGTLAVWLKSADVTGHEFVCGCPYDNGAWNDPWIGFQMSLSSAALRWNGAIQDVYTVVASGTVDFVAGVWAFATITWDGTNALGYVNAVNKITDTPADTGDITYGTPAPAFMIAERSAGATGELFSGTIGEVWSYNRNLSLVEITYLYNKTRFRYI